MNDNWISTEELFSYLKAHPNEEKECRLYLGNHLGSTHYWYWDSTTMTFMYVQEGQYVSISEQALLDTYSSCKWIVM